MFLFKKRDYIDIPSMTVVTKQESIQVLGTIK